MSQNGQTNLKILQHLLQNFESASDHFETLCIKMLIVIGACTVLLLSPINNIHKATVR